ncbi:TonB-dependent receptor domain-containing protein [Pseudomonas sp. NPDC007930]|uniref:TonB-dependent receptor n=1 Tax=Pseudomonas sp. NPDC007930 TaxID=3364417 RepID=UPI0036E191D3
MAAALPAFAEEPLELDAVDVSAETEGYRATHSRSPKQTDALRDTPRSLSVINETLIRDSAASTLVEALRFTPGITFGAGEGGNPLGDRPFIRGFDAQGDVYLDGVRDIGGQTRELFNLEAIELTRGPDSTLSGRGAAGGTLNLVSKLPKARDFTEATTTFGTDQTQRYSLDLNRRLGDSAAFRLNLLSHEQNVAGRQAVEQQRWGLAPSLALGLGGPTRLTLSHYHLRGDELPDSGIPYRFGAATGHVKDRPDHGGNRNNFYGLSARDFRKTRSDITTLMLEHDFNAHATLRNTLRVGNSGQDYLVTNPDGSQHNIDRYGTVWRRANSRYSDTDTASYQADLFGSFTALGFKHRYSAGLEASRAHTDIRRYAVSPNQNPAPEGCLPGLIGNGECTWLGRPAPSDPWAGSARLDPATRLKTQGDTLALYALDTVELAPAWKLNLGARWDRFDTTVSDPAGSRVSQTSLFWNGQAALIYKPVEQASLYVAYGSSATPPGALVNEGSEGNPLASPGVSSSLEPETTRNYELGAKWDALGEQLTLTAAVFRTEKENTRVLVDNATYRNAGTSRVDGLELTASGQLAPAWRLFAGYTYLASELVDGGLPGRRGQVDPTGVSPKGKRMPNAPQQSLALWSTYQLTPKLSLGGGAFYTSKVFGDAANSVYVPAYTRFDAMASYQLSRHVDLQLNVLNLTDKVYYDKVLGNHYASMAPGRTALLSTRVRF